MNTLSELKKRILLPASLLLVALIASGCGFQIVSGSGKIATETRAVSGFTSVTLAGIGDVYVSQGEAQPVRIEADDNLIPYFETVVEGSTLKIGLKNQYIGINLRPTRPIKFYVSLPKIEAITLAGSGNIFGGTLKTEAISISLLGSGNISADSLTATALDLHLSGSGNIRLAAVSAGQVTASIGGSGDINMDALSAQKISAKISGSGNFILSGKAADQSVDILGSGAYRAADLKGETASVRVTGSGNSQVSVTGTLNVTILGSGDVTYSGTPKVTTSVAGSGKVVPAAQ